ncbi:MAG: NUDIX domain-containing protein [Myxococcales bacterium]|nr:NUDIX domain-containing protein [Myxococcales bacterium]
MSEEQLYHVDRSDRVLGRVSRREAHVRGLLHRAGCVVICHHDGRPFMARRSMDKAFFPGHWDFPCSFHVAWGESYDEAAKRELREETGIEASPEPVGGVLVDETPDHLLVHVYKLVHVGPIRLDPKEAASGSFVTPAVLEDRLLHEATTSWFAPAWRLLRRDARQ